jgi:hypothetical protein
MFACCSLMLGACGIEHDVGGEAKIVNAVVRRTADGSVVARACGVRHFQTPQTGPWLIDRPDFVKFRAGAGEQMEVSYALELASKRRESSSSDVALPQSDSYWCSTEDESGPRDPWSLTTLDSADAFACLRPATSIVELISAEPILSSAPTIDTGADQGVIGYKVTVRVLQGGLADYQYDPDCLAAALPPGGTAPLFQPQTIELAP